jgi:hypothetical protein
MSAYDFPDAEFTIRNDLPIPSKDTVSRAAKALADDDSDEALRASASDVMNLHRDILDAHPEWAADFD